MGDETELKGAQPTPSQTLYTFTSKLTAMDERGALELSVNVIVILVIALVVIGLAVTFTVTKFSDTTSRIKITEPLMEPDADNPVQTPGGRTAYTFGRASAVEMPIKVYNPLNKEHNSYYTESIVYSCISPAGEEVYFRADAPQTIIKPGNTGDVPMLINAKEVYKKDTSGDITSQQAPPGKYACRIIVRAIGTWPIGNDGKPHYQIGEDIVEKYIEIEVK
jgi:hypothetical protein